MPLVTGAPYNGQKAITSAHAAIGRTLVFAVAGAQNTLEIQANGLPAFNAWFLQIVGSGAANVSVQLQFTQNNAIGFIPDWQNLIPAFPIVIGTPSLTNRVLGARRYRAVVTSDAATSVAYRVSASLA